MKNPDKDKKDMSRIIKRDYYIEDPVDMVLYFYKKPQKGIVKWFLRWVGMHAARYAPGIFRFYLTSQIRKKISHARTVNPLYHQWYVPGNRYVEVQIGNDTRTALLLQDNEGLCFEKKVEEGDEFLFGAAPLLDELESGLLSRWKMVLRVTDKGNRQEQVHTCSFPFGKRDDFMAYFPGEGWADFRFPLDRYVGRTCEIDVQIFFDAEPEKKRNDVHAALSAPQILRRRKKGKAQNVVVISVESLTSFDYLKQLYGEEDWPCIQELRKEKNVAEYPKVYSPTDATLPFAASVFSGLMPSQHGVGNYAVGADTFNNMTINENIQPISAYMKSKGLLTFFGGTEVRFSAKIGFARGFDHFFHEFYKWKASVPGMEWISRSFYNLQDFSKFFYVHFDLLHDPLISFNVSDKIKYHALPVFSGTDNEKNKNLYFYQLRQVDHHIGKLIHYLKFIDEFENTAILITGDHGSGINWVKHCEYSHYEERVRVPFIVKYPEWAEKRLQPVEITNSVTEINRIVRSLFGEDIPHYLKSLPQYSGEYDGFAFSETIMNPNKEYKRYSLALMDHHFKYVNRKKVDWDNCCVEEDIGGVLYQWDDSISTFNETKDVSAEKPDRLAFYRKLAEKYLALNLDFKKKYPPQPY